MIPEDPRVAGLWVSLTLVVLRYSIGEAVAFGNYARAEQLVGRYVQVARILVAP